jgi:hypothetical protein
MQALVRLPIVALLIVALLIVALGDSAVAQPTPVAAWKTTATLSAPEARQAAAADEDFAYAIDNAQIAKYDRATGRRVAVSTGKASHLNSGFFWKGRLYCAHSNYPKTPARSDIKVLDPATMQLSTWKDFGEFAGSLTWVVRQHDHWWCNFAHYGDDNGKTVLVKFDDQWREQARWTYPAALIAKLGRYSLSGGIWHDGRLLVTGHDERLLYCLRLPSEGSVLEWLETQQAPFTGQGIATDPKLQGFGLVGIDRGKGQIVFAAKPTAEGRQPE